MLYHILYSFHESVSWLNLFRYQTFRAALAFLFCFIFVVGLQPVFIAHQKRRGVKGQPIREEGPALHLKKSGTPTMGGIVIVSGVSLATLLFADLSSSLVWITLLAMLSFATLGFLDDWQKISRQNSRGVRGKLKLAWQAGTSLVIGIWLMTMDFSSTLTFPFLKDAILPLGVFFLPFVMIVIMGSSNAVNLTDGLDGLAAGPIMTVAAAYAFFAYIAGHAQFSGYLGVTYVPGAGELAVILAAVVAGGLGFLWYNTYPAQVFMGDVGALALGGVIGTVSVLVKQEILLVIAGGVFVVEALSVIIQTYSFKLTGKRVFRMAPIHHHFELLGWSEPKIIVRFWIVSIVLALISLTTLKLR